MQLKKITDIGKTGNYYVGTNEILTISWDNGANPAFFAFNSTKVVRQVDKEYFAVSIIGREYKKIEEQLPYSTESYHVTRDENGNLYFCFYQEGIIHGFDKNANKLLEWDLNDIGQGHSIYDIAYQYPDFLWLAFPTGQTVAQMSISERRETYKIGDYTWDDKEEPLSYPESIFVKNKYLFIPNMGSSKLFRFDVETTELVLIAKFQERIWQYGETEIGTFIVTDTGIYELEN